MTKLTIFVAVSLLVGAVLLLPRIWNSTENGPTINDPSAFIGCYGAGKDRVNISRARVYISKDHQSTNIIRFFYLKNDAAINTVNNIEYDVGGNDLHIGKAHTGFFYRFDNPTKPSAILIPDNGGIVRTLSRAAC